MINFREIFLSIYVNSYFSLNKGIKKNPQCQSCATFAMYFTLSSNCIFPMSRLVCEVFVIRLRRYMWYVVSPYGVKTFIDTCQTVRNESLRNSFQSIRDGVTFCIRSPSNVKIDICVKKVRFITEERVIKRIPI